MSKNYADMYPTCPKCKNDSLTIKNSSHSPYNYMVCSYCGFEIGIDIKYVSIDNNKPY